MYRTLHYCHTDISILYKISSVENATLFIDLFLIYQILNFIYAMRFLGHWFVFGLDHPGEHSGGSKALWSYEYRKIDKNICATSATLFYIYSSYCYRLHCMFIFILFVNIQYLLRTLIIIITTTYILSVIVSNCVLSAQSFICILIIFIRFSIQVHVNILCNIVLSNQNPAGHYSYCFYCHSHNTLILLSCLQLLTFHLLFYYISNWSMNVITVILSIRKIVIS